MPGAASPTLGISTLVTYSIKIEGKAIDDVAMATSIKITHEINKLSVAEVMLVTTTGVASTYNFLHGNAIEISCGYQGNDAKQVFKGIIVKHSMEVKSALVFVWELKCKHQAVLMTGAKKKVLHFAKTDSAIFNDIFGDSNYTAITKSITSTTASNDYLPQNNITDWDFLLSRTDFLGYIVCLDQPNIFVGKPNLSAVPVLTISTGDSMISFKAEMNGEKQFKSIAATTLDLTRTLITATANEPSFSPVARNIGSSFAAKLIKDKLEVETIAPMSQADLQTWVDGRLLRMRLSAIKGSVTSVGNATVKTGDWIKLEGVGDQYDVEAMASGINHVITKGSWKTTYKLGLEDAPINDKPNFASTSANGQMPPTQGLSRATVKALEGDPASEFRIKITDNLQKDDQGVWARMCHNYATGTAGFFFIPEVGDEVIVDYLNGDPRYPIIIGSLYSSKSASPSEMKDTNFIKMISTKNQLKLTFDDEKKVLAVETPGGNKITLSDDAKSIEITDQNSNTIKFSSDGIELSSSKDVTIKAQGNINLTASTGKIALAASASDVTVSALNISNTANMEFKAAGNVTAELSSGAQTVIKGAMVMIN